MKITITGVRNGITQATDAHGNTVYVDREVGATGETADVSDSLITFEAQREYSDMDAAYHAD